MELRVELLIGRRVVDASGDHIGRLEEIVADYVDEEYVVREFHVGAFAAFERLGTGMLSRGLLRLLGGHRLYRGYVIPWEQMDLSVPERPRATVPKAELRGIDEREYRASGQKQEAPPSRRSA